MPSFTEGLSQAGEGAQYNTALSLTQFIGYTLSAIMGILGVIFLILIIYGGFTWMTAAGDEKKVGKAKNIITAATVGLLIVVGAWGISNFVFDALQTATRGVAG